MPAWHWNCRRSDGVAGRHRQRNVSARFMDVYTIYAGDGRSTEELVEAGNYAWAHSQAVTANFPARQFGMGGSREIVLLGLGRQVTTEEMIIQAAGLGLERPTYEDALYFGAQHPQVQLDGPVAFLHEPWEGFYGRRDCFCLWSNDGRRELGLEDFDDPWSADHRFGFLRRAVATR